MRLGGLPRILVVGTAFGGAAFGVFMAVSALRAHRVDDTVVVLITLAGLGFVAGGFTAYLRRPENRTGLLMIGTGIGLFVWELRLTCTGQGCTTARLGWDAGSAFLVHLVLAFPTGRLTSRFQRGLTALMYVEVLILPAVYTLLGAWRFPADAPASIRPFDPATIHSVGFSVWNVLTLLVIAGIGTVLARRWRTATVPMRRMLASTLLVTMTCAVSALLFTMVPVRESGPVGVTLQAVFGLSALALPFCFLAGMVRLYLGRSAVGRLLMELRRPMTPQELEPVLSRALSDPAVRIAFVTSSGTLVDTAGAAVAEPRAVTALPGSGEPATFLVHDPLLNEDPHVLDAIAAAAGLALHNQRLTATVAERTAEMATSRAWAVEAADAERRRLERDLHDGAQQSLVSAMLGVRLAQHRLGKEHPDEAALLEDTVGGIERALSQMRTLARGLHPAVLSEGGLPAAVEALLEHCPLPVDAEFGDVPRLPAVIESSAYFVVAEALANTLKHGAASHARVTIHHGGGRLVVTVADDGRGGADPDRGTGLRGLRDRATALGGDLRLASTPGKGTTVTLAVPC